MNEPTLFDGEACELGNAWTKHVLSLSMLSSSWRKKKPEIRADAEARAKAVITEDYQKLGPIK